MNHTISYVRNDLDGNVQVLSVGWDTDHYAAVAYSHTLQRITDDVDRVVGRTEQVTVAQQHATRFRTAVLYRFTDDLLPRWESGEFDPQ